MGEVTARRCSPRLIASPTISSRRSRASTNCVVASSKRPRRTPQSSAITNKTMAPNVVLPDFLMHEPGALLVQGRYRYPGRAPSTGQADASPETSTRGVHRGEYLERRNDCWIRKAGLGTRRAPRLRAAPTSLKVSARTVCLRSQRTPSSQFYPRCWTA